MNESFSWKNFAVDGLTAAAAGIGIAIVAVALVAGLAALTLPVLILTAFTITQFWTWYVIPTFLFGASPLPVAEVFGLLVFFHLLKVTLLNREESTKTFKQMVNYTLTRVMGLGLSLLLGYLGTFWL